MKPTQNNRKSNKEKIENVNGISGPMRKWLVALGMTQDILEYCRQLREELKEDGYPVHDHNQELLEATREVRAVINKYLNEQIYISILGFGDDNVVGTSRI